MCWATIDDKCKKEHISRKDIPCYKVISINRYGDGYFAEYFNTFIYKDGKIYTSLIRKEVYKDVLRIYDGLHSYNTIETAYKEQPWLDDCGFDIIKCIIPKDSKFYLNAKGEIVSDKLIIIGLV